MEQDWRGFRNSAGRCGLSFELFAGLEKILIQHGAVQGEVHRLAFAPGVDQAGAGELLDVVRDGGGADIELLDQPGAGKVVAVGDLLEKREAGGI